MSYPCLLLFHFIACINCCHLCDVKTNLVPFSIVFVVVTLCFYHIVILPVFDSQRAWMVLVNFCC